MRLCRAAAINRSDSSPTSLTLNRTVPYSASMVTISKKGAEEARNQLPALLEAAEQGRATVITRRGKAVAALVPIEDFNGGTQQMSLASLEGTGRGLWGKDAARTIDEMRDEWER